MYRNRKKRISLTSSQSIALVFAFVILLGTLLLCLPFASRSGESCGLRTALFTATSSTCVTGLVLADTWTQWSGFGQIVLLCLIEIGGLGFMTIASTLIFALKRKMNMEQRLLIAQSIGSDGMGDADRIQKKILIGCLAVEGIGALILFLRFLPLYSPWIALKLSVFHAVSAFCNAGFDIFGFEAPGSSMMLYGTDAVVVLTLSALIIIGGIGFLVWDELVRIRRAKKWSVYTKLVLITTAALLIVGTLLFCLLEWNNPKTLGAMTVPQKLTAAFFQSVTTRTAGFAGIDQGALTDSSKAVTMLLMLIGGSSGSTAGGLKTVTFIVLMLFLWSRLTGKDSVNVFHRTIPGKQILNAVTLCGFMILLSFFGGAVICATSPASFSDGLYESISALATVGLSTGITPLLSVPAQFLIILYMYFGRVGILTLSLGFLQEKASQNKIKYAETNLLIG